MGHVGQKFAFGLVGSFSIIFCMYQLLSSFLNLQFQLFPIFLIDGNAPTDNNQQKGKYGTEDMPHNKNNLGQHKTSRRYEVFPGPKMKRPISGPDINYFKMFKQRRRFYQDTLSWYALIDDSFLLRHAVIIYNL